MAETEKEITVKLKLNLDETKLFFVNKGIPLVESFVLKDTYMIKEDVDVSKTPNLDLLSQALMLRECIGNEHTKALIYKDKTYDKKGNILNSIKYSCPLVDIDKTYDLLKAIKYKECFRYEQECLCYANDKYNVLIEYIPDLGLFAELENNNKSIEELISELNELNIPYYENDYFVKKASLMLNEIKKRR